jgi:hypothetical protein
MMLVQVLMIGEKYESLNSKKFNRHCEDFNKILLDNASAVNAFQTAAKIFRTLGIEMAKR